MRLLFAVAFGAALLSACRATSYQRVLGPVPIAQGTPSEFTPVVQPSTGPARCEVRPRDGAGADGRVISLVHDEPAEQRISVTVDAQGVPVLYLDVRGDPSADEEGDRTTIGLYITQGYAVAGNRASGRQLEVFEFPLEEAADAESLGNPAERLTEVLTACGGAV